MEKCFCGRFHWCSEKTIPPLYKGTINSAEGKRRGIDPSIGFCIDWLLGAKYAVCQEILTEKRAVGQETLTKTLLQQKNPDIKQE